MERKSLPRRLSYVPPLEARGREYTEYLHVFTGHQIKYDAERIRLLNRRSRTGVVDHVGGRRSGYYLFAILGLNAGFFFFDEVVVFFELLVVFFTALLEELVIGFLTSAFRFDLDETESFPIETIAEIESLGAGNTLLAGTSFPVGLLSISTG